jgi:nitrogenase molybdenum-iron protein alpha/beta subunit
VGPDQGHDPHLATARSAAASIRGLRAATITSADTGIDTFGTMQFTSDFQEKDIVFGGDKKLEKIIDEIEESVPAEQGHHGPVRMPDRPDR